MGKITQEDNHLKIEYSNPMGGIDSSALAPYINGQRLVDVFNALIRNNSYIAANWKALTFGDAATFDLSSQLIGIADVPTTGNSAGIYYITSKLNTISSFLTQNLNTPSASTGVLTTNSFPGRVSSKTINKTVYLSGTNWNIIAQYAPSGSTYALSLLTSSLGGKFIGEVNGRLVAFNVTKWVSGAAQYFPYQIAWSADSQQYGVWNVLDINNNVTGAGYNNLPDVEDEITGVIYAGPTTYILRRQGITEMVPLNSGIQPFDFNHMWASHKGIGTIYPNTVSQYGAQGCFLSDTDIFSLGVGGFEGISGYAKRMIYKYLQASNQNVWGLMTPLMINDTPELCYILNMIYTQNNGAYLVSFIYSHVTKEWMKFSFQINPSNVLAGNTIGPDEKDIAIINSVAHSNLDSTALVDRYDYSAPLLVLQQSLLSASSAAPTFFTIPPYPSN